MKTGALAAGLVFVLACGDSDNRPAASTTASTTASQPSSSAGDSDESAGSAESTESSEELVQRGRGLYMSNCIACHNQDPTETGAVGPAIAGSSFELLTAKVLRNEYPEGYTPKRDSRAMVPLGYLEKKLPAIHAFLNAKQ